MNTDNLIPAGRYLARAVDSVLGKTSKGSEQLAITFQIVAPESYEGRQLVYYGYFTDKTVDKTLEALENTGWDGESIVHPIGVGSIDSSIVVEHEADDKGQMRARIRWVNRPGGAAVKEKLDVSDAMALEQRLKGKMLARKQQAQAHSNGGGDDVPF